MLIYNTLNGQKEEFQTVEPGRVGMYVCGPTTYNFIHLGNARPLVVFDTFRRFLMYSGYEVTYIQNFTDVDDKIIDRANELGEDPVQFAARYIEEYFVDADSLGVMRADIHPKVSEHMTDIIEAVATLIEKGHAYEREGDVYFRVRSFDGYGKLSKRNLDDMLAGARVEVDGRKEEAADFALWKKAKPGEPAWDSPWGPGRPGWHIECSVMSAKYLGKTLDIHGGGNDLIFPHHENEIAQSEALNGQQFVNYWMHNGFITINSEKMSKSLGNFFIVRDVLKKFRPDVVRYYLLATHYRSPLDFDDGKLEEAGRALGRLKNTLYLAEGFLGERTSDQSMADEGHPLAQEMLHLKQDFIGALNDDFNTARAMGSYFEMSRAINSHVATARRDDPAEQQALAGAVEIFRQLGDVLGIYMDGEQAISGRSEALLPVYIEVRRQARELKDWAMADFIRDLMAGLQVEVQDGAEGSVCRYETVPRLDGLVEGIIQLRKAYKDKKDFVQADFLRGKLEENGIIIEDTKEGTRWKSVD